MHWTSITPSIIALLCLASTSHCLVSPRKRATVCNGRAELCSRPYGNTTFLMAHDSFAFSTNPLILARDQEVDIPSQLNIGARGLQAQAHMQNGQLRFCHTSCALFDGGLVVDYLKTVKTFLDANPSEVVTFIFTNPDGASVQDVWKPAFDDSGITPLAYVPPTVPMKRTDWPTLGEILDMGKQVIVFLDAGADQAPTVDFILPEFEMVWEDPFDPTDNTFPCKIDRTAGPLSNDDHMHLINHNLNKNIIPIGDGVLVSDPLDAPKTNSVTSIVNHANGCAGFALGRAPNFVLVDYVNLGQGKQAVDTLNGF